jgi:hypothetical protein
LDGLENRPWPRERGKVDPGTALLFSLNEIPTQEWVANVAFLQFLLFGYDLAHWFKRLCLPEGYLGATVETIRNEFLVLPAKLAKHGSRNVLQLPKDYHHREIFLAAAQD